MSNKKKLEELKSSYARLGKAKLEAALSLLSAKCDDWTAAHQCIYDQHIKEAEAYLYKTFAITDAIALMGDEIPAETDIVRCKDCTMCRYDAAIDKYYCETFNGMHRNVMPEEYCSYATRREG